LPLLVALVFDASSVLALILSIASGLLLAAAALAWAIGRSARDRRDYEDRLAEWAASSAVAAERLRIARDLHDISSHGLGIITVRAAATGYLVGSDAEAQRKAALTDIERISRQTTIELRRMLTVLRTPDEGPAPMEPAATLADLPAIIERAERGGLLIETELEGIGPDAEGAGSFDALEQGLELTVCTVVAEGLTNVLRHGGRRRCVYGSHAPPTWWPSTSSMTAPRPPGGPRQERGTG